MSPTPTCDCSGRPRSGPGQAVALLIECAIREAELLLNDLNRTLSREAGHVVLKLRQLGYDLRKLKTANDYHAPRCEGTRIAELLPRDTAACIFQSKASCDLKICCKLLSSHLAWQDINTGA